MTIKRSKSDNSSQNSENQPSDDQSNPTSKNVDPNAQQEAERYVKPVPSRDYILDVLDQKGAPASLDELIAFFELEDEEEHEGLRRRLIAMCRDGQLIENRKRKFLPLDKTDLLLGKVSGSKDGSGVVVTEQDRFYLSSRQMRQVFDGDRVNIRPMGSYRKDMPEAIIAEVLERNTKQLVGRFFEQAGMCYITPGNRRITQDILIPPQETKGAEHGQFVVVEILEYPALNQLALGKVKEVLGDHLAPGMEIDVALRSHNIPFEWPDGVLQQVKELPSEVEEKDKLNRIDIRHLPLVTIDGEDAKDFDDAVYAEFIPKTRGWRLYVAIADVSHYVQVGSELDQEARTRSTSVYFPEHVVPMLPEQLSNGLCSLKPSVDRLCMVCEMTISETGKLSGYQFYEAVMHSHARLTYTKVGALIDEPESAYAQEIMTQFPDLVPHLYTLYDLYRALRAQRTERGAIDFETTETRIIFDENRKIQEVVPVERNDAHKIIEECMLMANVATAKFLEKLEIPALYRVHEGPSDSRLENLKQFLSEMALELEGGDEPKPNHYQKLLQKIADRPDANIIQTLMLRSMQQAVYQPDNLGHFGLNYKAYTHFTSPIRRYPDLLVHRAIRSVIRGDSQSEQVLKRVKRDPNASLLPKNKIYPYDMGALLELGEHTSMCERRADDATREVMDFLKCEFMSNHLGEQYTGTIATVTGFGLFVQLTDIYIEGLIHISNLQQDYYHFDEVHHRLVGERSGKQYRIGDELDIVVAKVDIEDRKIDFSLVEGKDTHRFKKRQGRASEKSASKRTSEKNLPPGRLPRKRPVSGKTIKDLEDAAERRDKALGIEANDGESSNSKRARGDRSKVDGTREGKGDSKSGKKSSKKLSKRQKLNKAKSSKKTSKKKTKKKPSKK